MKKHSPDQRCSLTLSIRVQLKQRGSKKGKKRGREKGEGQERAPERKKGINKGRREGDMKELRKGGRKMFKSRREGHSSCSLTSTGVLWQAQAGTHR